MLLDIEVTGVNDLEFKINSLEHVDFNEALEDAAAVLLNRIRTRFLDQTDPDGRKWPESAAARLRRASGRDGGTLFDTGNLFHSIQLFDRGSNEVGIGTDVEYGLQHQEGLNGLPKRTFIGFSGDDVEIASLVFKNKIEALLGG